MLTKNLRQSELSIAYVHAIAAKMGCALEHTRVDMDSVDVTIKAKGKLDSDSILESPELAIQLKATKNLSLNEKNEYPFSLSIKNYDDLRANSLVPKILVVLFIPEIEDEWLIHTVEKLILKKCAYWVSIKGLPKTENDKNKTIYIPENNVFTPETLKMLLIKVSSEDEL